MQHSLQDQCMCMDQSGMHLHGLQRMENIKQIILTNPSLEDTKTSNYKVVPLIPPPHAGRLLSHLPAMAASWAVSKMLQCNGSKKITWSMIIVMILRETIHLLQNVKIWFGSVQFGVKFKFTFYICICITKHIIHGVVFEMVPHASAKSIFGRAVNILALQIKRNDWDVFVICATFYANKR